jgi:hypothetical protein
MDPGPMTAAFIVFPPILLPDYNYAPPSVYHQSVRYYAYLLFFGILTRELSKAYYRFRLYVAEDNAAAMAELKK